MDMGDEVDAALQAAGYNVTAGSLGTPYKIPRSDEYQPVIVNGKLPSDYTEQEIIVVNLEPAAALDAPVGDKLTAPGENDWWASCSAGEIDPRPRLMSWIQEPFDRIHAHGGVFVIFACARVQQELRLGHLDRYKHLSLDDQLHFDNWSLLSELDYGIEARFDHGREMTVVESGGPLGQLLAVHLRSAHFTCALHPTRRTSERWIPLAQNKYSAPVAGALCPLNEQQGWILIFPHVHNKSLFLVRLLNEVLPDLAPHLFPHVEGVRWVQRPEYELPTILTLKDTIEQVQEEARRRVAELESCIEEERRSFSYLHDLITATGDPLVAAVKRALEATGFQAVVNMDEERTVRGDAGPRREDLQIRDASPLVLVEVKGISQLPREAAALQVTKYLAPRMKDLRRTDIHGLSIINHQRNLPALDRENKTPFSDDVLTNAQDQGFGLMTTWDLLRLTRSYVKNRWKHEQVKELFYRSGRIEPVPCHYRFVGVVEQFWPNVGAVGIRIETGGLRQGDRIAFELPAEFEEQHVESLQVNREQVDRAEPGMLAGVRTHLAKEQAKKGLRVFRIQQTVFEG